jgi:2',3'-cyclic-nucleotide 2'-phosphodiesterase (5'-nucleotidase family)
MAFAREAQAADIVSRLTFLLVNDVYRINEDAQRRGGMARLAAVVKSERARAAAEERHLICVHAGDTLSPSLMSSLDQGAHMIALFNEVGLDVFVPGNHEFDFGKQVYLERAGEARFPFLAANLRDHEGNMLPHHQDQLLIESGGLKLALIGAALDSTPNVSRSGDLVFSPALATITEKAKAARAAGADLVIAIIHADKPTGTALMDAHVVDLILSGHNHDLHIDFDGRTALMESAQDANYIVTVDLDVALKQNEAARSLSWWPNFKVTDTARVDPDPVLLAKVRVYEDGLAKTLDVELAIVEAPLDSRTEIVRGEESAIGNLVADALRKAADAEVALVNGGGIRGNRTYPTGTQLTRRDVLDELPFGNKTIVVNVEGRSLWLALENGFSQVERQSGRFPQVSGLIVTADLAAKPGARVKSVTINGKDLDPARRYKLATNDFLARGGDGYWMLAGGSDVTADSGTRLVAQDVMDYIEAEKRVTAKVEGRIVFV